MHLDRVNERVHSFEFQYNLPHDQTHKTPSLILDKRGFYYPI